MAYFRLDSIRPGVDTELTPLANRGGWSFANLCRWRSGKLETLRGWAPAIPDVLAGVCRALHFWVDLNGTKWFAFGTNTNLYVFDAFVNKTLIDITPTAGFTPGKASSGNVTYSLLIWSLDNFGEDLIATASQQGIFTWKPVSVAPYGVATRITQAPAFNQGSFVSMPQEIIIAYGCTPLVGTSPDPMLVRWCDAGDFTDWTASATNLAGSFRLSRGSHIVGGISAPAGILLWTDTDLWLVQFIGFPLVFGFFLISEQTGLIAQKAAIAIGSLVYWMSDHGFFRFSGGGAEQIPCPVWDAVYLNIDMANWDKCVAGSDYLYNEIYFFFPSVNSSTGEIDSYVKLNTEGGWWDYGPATQGAPNPMARTAWTDINHPRSAMSVALNGLMIQGDQGFTMFGVDPVAAMATTGFQDMTDGLDFVLVDQFIPDFLWEGDEPSLSITLLFRNYPGDPITPMGPFTITPSTKYITLRHPTQITVDGTVFTAYPSVRAREVAVQIDNISGWWRWGSPRLRVTRAGRL